MPRRRSASPQRNLAFAPFRSLLAVATDRPEVLVWDLDKPENPHARFEASAHELVFSADARRLATVCWNTGATLIWDVPR